MRTCTKCGTLKPETEYYLCVIGEKSYLKGHCKFCYRKSTTVNPISKKCFNCGKEFTTEKRNYEKHKFCSRYCGQVDWRNRNKERNSINQRSYYKVKKSNSIWWENHKAHQREIGRSPSGRFYRTLCGAKIRNLEFKLSKDEFMSFWKKDCHYCGEKIEGIGIDRIDNSKGYIIGNCVPSCKICNTMKMAMTLAKFIARCKKIIGHHNLSG